MDLKETISEKAAADKIDYDERAFEHLAQNAPEEVKKRGWKRQKKQAFYRAFIDKLERL